MDNFFSAWKSQIYDVSKGKYWTHTDGSKWWHNPDSDKIEPYNPEHHSHETHIDVTQVMKYNDASAVADIPHGSLMPVLFAARLMVNHVKAGMSKQNAMLMAAKYVKKSISTNTNLEDLHYRHKAFTQIGMSDIATIIAERYQDVQAADTKSAKEQYNVEPEAKPEPLKPETPIPEPAVPEKPEEKPVEQPKPEPIPDDGGYDKKLVYQGKELKYKHLPKKLGGSTGAYLVEITDGSGNKETCVVKEYHGNAAQVRNEHFANVLYRELNEEARVHHVDLGTTTMDNGNTALLTKYLPDMILGNDLSPNDTARVKTQLHNTFVFDAWLANWDVVGLSDDNIGINPHNERLVKFDNGGALEFRAQGSPKGEAFGSKVVELDTMRDPSKAPSAAKWFGDITDEELAENIEVFSKKIKKVGAAGLYSLAAQAGYNIGDATAICDKLLDRANYIAKYGKKLTKEKDEAFLKEAHKTSKWKNMPELEKATEAIHDNVLLPKEKLALDKYTASGFLTINNAIVSGKKNPNISPLKKALAKLPKFTGISMRGVSQYPNAAEHFEKWKSGEWSSCEWAAFTSTSIRPRSQFGSAYDGVSFVILNKGISGGYVGRKSSHSHEAELLLAPGSQHKVVGVCERGGYNREDEGRFDRCVILEEVSSKEFEKLPPSQESPKQWDYQELMKFIKENAISE